MLSTNDLNWMSQAIQLAKRAEEQNEVPVGALLVYEENKIAEGWNQPISHCDPTAHAEIIALRNAAKTMQNYRLLNTTLYVTLEPCAMCLGAMIQARIKRLVFGAYDLKAGAVQSVFQLLEPESINHKIVVQGGVQMDECQRILQQFFQARRSEKKIKNLNL